MPRSRVRLVDKRELAPGTMSFHFAKPAGFAFRAGQFADYTLLDPAETDADGSTRAFTIASAPFEPELVCTVRVRDTAFKRALNALPIGSEVELDGPQGFFVLHRDASRPAVFLVGGIGITPARSIVCQIDHDRCGRRVVVFCSNRRPDDAPHLTELMALASSNPDIEVVPTMTGPEAPALGWAGHVGRIDAALLTDHLPDVTAPVYYLCGPAGMVAAMHDLLAALGVDDDDVRAEEFLGY